MLFKMSEIISLIIIRITNITLAKDKVGQRIQNWKINEEQKNMTD